MKKKIPLLILTMAVFGNPYASTAGSQTSTT